MKKGSIQKISEIANLFRQIQKDLDELSSDDAGIVQLFFDAKFNIYEISQVYDLPPNDIKDLVKNFLLGLLSKNHLLRRFLTYSCQEGQGEAIDLERQAYLLIESSETIESRGAIIRELVGVAIQNSIPPVPPDVLAEVISKVDAIPEPYKDHPIKDFLLPTKICLMLEAIERCHKIIHSPVGQLETISGGDDELLCWFKPTRKLYLPPPVEKPQLCDTGGRLSDFYGVKQIGDSVVFVGSYPRASRVEIAGDFNSWDPSATPMQRVGDSWTWRASLRLRRGMYRYRLLIDQKRWQHDLYNEKTEPNPWGEPNSVFEVK